MATATMASTNLWQRHQRYLCRVPDLGLALDVSRMRFDDDFLEWIVPSMRKAFQSMDALEQGAIANSDEDCMVRHYWLRTPDLAAGAENQAETVFSLLEHLAANGRARLAANGTPAETTFCRP